MFSVFFFECTGDHRDLHVLTHSFPTRRSSDLLEALARAGDGPGFVQALDARLFLAAARGGQRDGDVLVDVRQVADPDAADLLAAELHVRAVVERHALADTRAAVAAPGEHQHLAHGIARLVGPAAFAFVVDDDRLFRSGEQTSQLQTLMSTM